MHCHGIELKHGMDIKGFLLGFFVVLIMGLGSLTFMGYGRSTMTTSTTTVTTTLIDNGISPVTNTTAVSIPSTGIQSTGKLYNVTFIQEGACSPEFWGVPWSVTVDGQTLVQPVGTELPLNDFALRGTTNQSLSIISFLLPDGSYQYQIRPSAGFFTPSSGTVNVEGNNMTVDIAYTGTSCITTITPSP